MRFISVTSARKGLSELVEAADRVVITKAGQPEAVLLPIEDYRAIMVTQALAQSPDHLARIVAAHKQVLSGNLSETELQSRQSSKPLAASTSTD